MTTRTSSSKQTEFVRRAAVDVGFDICAITHADRINDLRPRLERFVTLGRHGTMGWMEETLERRGHPRALWPEARAIIMLGLSYAPDTDPMGTLDKGDTGTISVYARNRDYHDVIKGRLKTLASKIVSKLGGGVKVFVDTAPVMEKPLAEAAGLGWQGKHTNLVSREHGSWLFLGAIFTTLDLPDDAPESDHCGSCTRCLDICPTNAFPAPYQLDARRCISYLTIEHKGPIPEEFRKAMGNRIYGCDDCLAVCPWNKFAGTAREAKLKAREDLKAPKLADLLTLDDASFRQFFSGSPIKRIGRDRFIRNCLIAAGNSDDPSLVPRVAALQDDPSDIVRDAAEWARAELRESINT
ncbi:MAG: tRNA epoxyqueuosine(34) reductase QueG [Rhizobiales bacterium]|nr:tRNA epoxyqueuosine(34) reductase QueG [Hyphomicrobiales bacterium]MBO6700669.1 tRNA epoxyqueuosine(34) reductase QueG [Hyphomicrobiales bacterium]MBO6738205.1 tRNA epoxyqueuosine(34) reductase QueG [Hyphomicrobiales bacterium]MBO6913488.1 tRNA epoxyqueuosine(34) reductase QueG [Hyphomicrobiales bacterium]MBO6957304.1 tRNA epoxyqueuosine(34) reductase QueG [Hyphomicrobiales bacterium]